MDFRRFKTAHRKAAFSLDGFVYCFDKRARDGERLYRSCIHPTCSVRMETAGMDGDPSP